MLMNKLVHKAKGAEGQTKPQVSIKKRDKKF